MNKRKCILAAFIVLVVLAGCRKKVDVALGTSTLNIAAQGESVEVALTSNGDWTVEAHPEWITVNPTSGKGDATLTLSASLNDTEAKRSGTLRVSTKDNTATLKVSQDAMEQDYILVSPQSIESEAAGGDFTLTVTSNCDWSLSTDANWLSCEPVSGNGNGTVTVSITPVEGDIEVREADIVFSGVENGSLPVHVVQHAAIHYPISVEPSLVSADYEASEITVAVTCEGSWTAALDADWVTLSATSGNGNTELTVTLTENEVMEARLAHVTFSSETEDHVVLIIKQEAAPDPHFLEINPTEFSFGKEGGSAEININCDTEWIILMECEWASLSTQTGVGNGTITLTVDPNLFANPRFVEFKAVSGMLSQILTVSQEAGDELLTAYFEPDTVYPACTGGFQNVNLFSNCSWHLDASDWIYLNNSSGNGDASFNIIVDGNNSPEARTGYVNVKHNGEVLGTLTVIQEGKPNIFETDFTELDVSPEGGLYPMQLTSSQSWNLNCDVDWLSCSPESGGGNSAIVIRVAPSESPRLRTGHVKIVGSMGALIIVTVNQHE